jgi:hypothetical protein
MDDTKAWYASQTIWASLLQMAVGVGVATGVINDAAGSAIVGDGPGLIIGLVTAVLGVWSLYGRVKASKTIS